MPKYTLYYFNSRGRAEICRMLFAAANIPYNDVRIDYSEWDIYRSKMPGSCLPVLEINDSIQIPQTMAIARYLARQFGFYGKHHLDMARVDFICDSFYDIFNDYMRMYHDQKGRVMFELMSQMREWYAARNENSGYEECYMQPSMAPSAQMSQEVDNSDTLADCSEMRSQDSMVEPPSQKLSPELESQSSLCSERPQCGPPDPMMGSDFERLSFNEGRMLEMRRRYDETCRRVLPFLEGTLKQRYGGDRYFMGEYMTMCDLMCYCALENPLLDNAYLLHPYPKLRGLRDRVSRNQRINSYFTLRNYTDF
uniref:S-crystallin SL18 n=1 Tax=Nototodarus sloanii TaxID=215440 RepID=SCR18_NOTSL|nr:RecName: Full=S-crystallin SL18 [Nototodarus sloanii]AAA29404.1 S-crystallin [Nototodarus sloanii]